MRDRKFSITAAVAKRSRVRILFQIAVAVLALMADAFAQPVRSAPPSGFTGATGVPRFDDFPVTTGSPARTAPLVLTSRDRQYRTRLQAAARERPNFAGHSVLTTWGCGTECLYGAVVNLRTGRVTFLPFATCCLSESPNGDDEMVAFRQDSALLVLIGMRDKGGRDIGSHLYRIQGDRFMHLRSVPFAVQR